MGSLPHAPTRPTRPRSLLPLPPTRPSGHLCEDDLGREVLGRAAKREGALGHLLGEAEVGDFDVALAVEEKVLGQLQQKLSEPMSSGV